jgi:transcriptional regulator
MELLEIMETNKARIERERIEKERKEREQKAQATLKLCEELSEKIEGLAQKGKDLTVYFNCTEKGAIMTPTTRDYADSRISYHYQECIDLDLLKDYFKQYCFDITVVKRFEYWYYGCGKFSDGMAVRISPNPCEF